jgi:hypothetical protein
MGHMNTCIKITNILRGEELWKLNKKLKNGY